MYVMDIHSIPILKMDGTETSLEDYARDVVLVVNVASRCGLAPQYAKLETLQRTYGERGFTVLGFPSNQFLQELGSNEAIQEFCSTSYGVTFPVFDRVRVNGRNEHPLYKELKKTPTPPARQGGSPGILRSSFSCPPEKSNDSGPGSSPMIPPSSPPSNPTCPAREPRRKTPRADYCSVAESLATLSIQRLSGLRLFHCSSVSSRDSAR